jgi:tRNA A-37 threonylcarbamoyl transferase component Bud32
VIVKVFSDRISARRHIKREWRGLSLLQARGLSSPEPLFYGQTEAGQWAAVVKKIADSSTVLDILGETTNKAKRIDLLVPVCKELAKQHSKGVLQKDLHLGNFLVAGGKVFALDPGQMQFFPRQIAPKRSISQLALLVCCLPAGKTGSISRVCEEYARVRGWRFSKSVEALLVAVLDRGFCEGAEPLDFIKQIDGLMDAGKILKDGNTCYVSGVSWNGKAVVVKRYNHKGFIHSLRHTIKRSRARRAWLHGHQLGMLNISTPKPLAYIEQRKGTLVWKSYLVTEYVEGQKLYDFLRDDNVTEEKQSEITQQVKKLLDKLGEHRISHGDLKHTNILITENGPVLSDLDGMQVHKLSWAYKIRQNKDIKRFVNGGLVGHTVLGDKKFLKKD